MQQNNYLENVKKQFDYYKLLGEKTINQLPDEKLFWQYNEESNSIAIIVQHIAGNMLSRWTDIFTTDGEKEWRNRDAEFDAKLETRDAVLSTWNKGWDCFLNTLNSLTSEDLDKTIYIRNMGLSVQDAIDRQLAHYPYHIGQIVFIGKMILNENWQSLSIPKGNSSTYNADKFSQPKEKKHFADEFLDKK